MRGRKQDLKLRFVCQNGLGTRGAWPWGDRKTEIASRFSVTEEQDTHDYKQGEEEPEPGFRGIQH